MNNYEEIERQKKINYNLRAFYEKILNAAIDFLIIFRMLFLIGLPAFYYFYLKESYFALVLILTIIFSYLITYFYYYLREKIKELMGIILD